jgi:2-polyprenyl-3-methyl-5-hydroxy-6-metoxy-1,4-benzoquinol methylase
MKYKKLSRPPSDLYHACNVESRNSKILAGMWDDFVNAKKRMESEGPFLLRHLPREPGRRTVFDACMGTGVDSIFLLKNGYEVTGNELDRHFLARAAANSSREGVSPSVVSYDWRRLGSHIKSKSFDAVICLGNSLTYLFDRLDQFGAVHNFFNVLKDNGVLIVDTRNYDYILDSRRDILEKGIFRYSGKYVYCGTDKVHAMPVRISEDGVLMGYTALRNEKKGHLLLYPFRRTELHDIIAEAGFKSISFFSDFRPVLDPNADFYQFVCRKSQAI